MRIFGKYTKECELGIRINPGEGHEMSRDVVTLAELLEKNQNTKSRKKFVSISIRDKTAATNNATMIR